MKSFLLLALLVFSSAVRAEDTIICEEIMGEGTIASGELCYNECKPKRGGLLGWAGVGEKKEGLERKSCIDCLLRHPERYQVKSEFLPKREQGVRVSGVTTRAGTVCRDQNGNVVTSGGTCSTESTGPRFNCSTRTGSGECISARRERPAAEPAVRTSSSEDCYECNVRSSRTQSSWSGIAEIAGALAGPLAALGTSYFNSRAQIKSQQAWANAAATGYEQCTLSQTNYLNYLSTNELTAMTPEQQANMNCNSYSMNPYSSYGMMGMGMGSYGYGYGYGYGMGMGMGMNSMYGGYGMTGMMGMNSMYGGYGMMGMNSMYGNYGMNSMTGMSGMTGLSGMYGSTFPLTTGTTANTGLNSGMFFNFQ
ncbi:MAG: hypothetical protein V4598_07920 [Bdellovibrionota bacterium]